MEKTRIKIRVQSYGKNDHYSIEFWKKTFFIFGKWVSYGSAGGNVLLDFSLSDSEKHEIVSNLCKYIKRTCIFTDR